MKNAQESIESLLGYCNFKIAGKRGDHFVYENNSLDLVVIITKKKDYPEGTMQAMLKPIILASIILDVDVCKFAEKQNLNNAVIAGLKKTHKKAKESPMILFSGVQKTHNIRSNADAARFIIQKKGMNFDRFNKYNSLALGNDVYFSL